MPRRWPHLLPLLSALISPSEVTLDLQFDSQWPTTFMRPGTSPFHLPPHSEHTT
jgi:hypothetical protein